jgi:hypothetical protein
MKVGLLMGAFIATGFSLARWAGTGESALPQGIDGTEHVLLLFSSGAVGGLVFGFLVPVTRSRWGAALTGMLSLVPYYGGQWWLRGAPTEVAEALGLLVVIPLVGGLVGYYLRATHPVRDGGKRKD